MEKLAPPVFRKTNVDNDSIQNLIMGMEKQEYNRKASAHTKANIFLWFIAGIIFNVYKGNLFSISTLLLIIPGIFIISFASIISFFVDVKKHQIVPGTNNVFILLLFTLWHLIDIVYPIVLSIGYIMLMEYLLKLF